MSSLPYDKYITPREASKLLRVTVRTLEVWADDGKLPCIRTKGNHRRFLLSDVITKSEPKQEIKREKICYCRVSSKSQKEDLERQIEFFHLKYPDHEIISDIGSGLNFNRKGFNSILDSSLKGNIEEIVVTHRDRLCRFGFELVERIIESHHGKIVVLDRDETSPEKELVDDILSIITVFSGRFYGLRSHSIRKKIRGAIENPENETISNRGREISTQTDV